MAVLIEKVDKRSPCFRKGLRDGDSLVAINGNAIRDVLDYRFYATEEKLQLTFVNHRGKTKTRRVRCAGDADSLGLSFQTYLMDRHHACKNKCIFCFIDQMPKGMRESLYFKDDDSRLSFLFGNYITLTGLSEEEVQRIIKMHISPMNISVHTMNPELRVSMMKNSNAGASLGYLRRFAEAGIRLNTQLVLCPGINDGEELTYSLEKLAEFAPAVQSIAAVPVGLTKHRDGLTALHGYTKEQAADVIDRIDRFNLQFGNADGQALAFAADEFYLLAQRDLPECAYYGDFCQFENGVGMLALLQHDFVSALQEAPAIQGERMRLQLATGAAAYPYIYKLCGMFMQKYPQAEIEVTEVVNHFFGESVTVAGLITGQDLCRAFENKDIRGEYLLIPNVMLRSAQEPVFLDDYTIPDIEAATGARVSAVGCGGDELFDALYKKIGGN